MAGRPRTGTSVKQVMTVRLAPEMAAEVRRYSASFTTAVEQALAMWLAREKRRQTTKSDKLAKHLAPAAREIAARRKRETA
jgi:hypothetical protein